MKRKRKLSDEDVVDILTAYHQQTASMREMGKMCGVIGVRDNWKHV